MVVFNPLHMGVYTKYVRLPVNSSVNIYIYIYIHTHIYKHRIVYPDLTPSVMLLYYHRQLIVFSCVFFSTKQYTITSVDAHIPYIFRLPTVIRGIYVLKSSKVNSSSLKPFHKISAFREMP